MATYSSILAWEIPWTEEPGGVQTMGLQKIQIQLSDYEQQKRLNAAQGLFVFQIQDYSFVLFCVY